MKILITGVTGFLGSHLAKMMLEGGVSVDTFIHKHNLPLDLVTKVNTFPFEGVLDRIKKQKYDCIIHTATNYGRNTKTKSIIDSNIVMPLMLLESVNFKKTFFINIDSFFNKSKNRYYSLPHYSLSKRSLLLWLEYYASSGCIVNLRIEHLFGPGDSPEKFVSRAISEIGIRKEASFSLTSGSQLRDFIYVTDVCTAITTAVLNISKMKNGLNEYEIGTGKSVSIKDFVEEVKLISNSNTSLNFGALPDPPGEIQNSFADGRFAHDFSWIPKTSLSDGIRACLGMSTE
jgi:CDP-paratose synthetase